MSKPRVVHAFSAGGVVFQPIAGVGSQQNRAAAGLGAEPEAGLASAPANEHRTAAREYEIVLVGETSSDIWVLPKGTPIAGETPEETAIREVREETGIEPRIVGDLGSIQYWFTRKGVRFKKEVKHYLMRAVGGDIAAHDHEYAEARWFPIDEAMERLSHENEAAIVRRAAAELRKVDQRVNKPESDSTRDT